MTHPLGCHSKTGTGIRPRRSVSLAALKVKANVKIEIASAVIDNAAVMDSMIDRQAPAFLDPRDGQSSLQAVVDLRAVVNIEDVDHATVFVDPIDDAISAAPGAVTAAKRPEQRVADPVRIDCKRGIAKHRR
jgi:hypothetical protein